MFIGHINLAKSFNGTGEHFVSLVEDLQRKDVAQYVLVRNMALARRISAVDEVAVGPVVRSAVMAYCHMPQPDIVHVHDIAGSQAGLLLALTRSIPFVLTHRGEFASGRSPIIQAVYRRASSVICGDDSELSILRHFDSSLHIEIIPDIARSGSADAHLRVYQNSQRMPTAGRSGIQ